MTDLQVIPIPAERLGAMMRDGRDDLGNPVEAWSVHGWEPLRCCLRVAEPGEDVALVSYRPFDEPSPWAEVGPVFVHRSGCPGYADPRRLPEQLRSGPRILRTYAPDGSLDYADITRVPDGEDLQPFLEDLLSRPGVDRVHVRADASQCFTYEVRAGRESNTGDGHW
ncbi:MAG: DUF1203 domain-containing protein [Nocardioidaceae bacterium]|nr:DUF1203 domain-containing protein [Nocardioidaceae bacterium]NUS52685.1 DUF1203 domain-containing protein [Nocardioidaceae bacterium]